MSKLIDELRNKLAAMTGAKPAKEADQEAVDKLKEAADEIAAKKLELKKKGIGDNIADQLTAEMLPFKEYEADRIKWNAFADATMEHIEATQAVLDGLNKDIDGRIEKAMNELLAKVVSKTEVPAARHVFEGGEIKELTGEEQAKVLKDFEVEQEKNRKLKVKTTQ